MPTQIGLLTNLVSVTFAQTGLYGTLPTEIGALSCPVPSCLTNCFHRPLNVRLTERDCPLTDRRKLKTFNIFGNQVTGVIPTVRALTSAHYQH